MAGTEHGDEQTVDEGQPSISFVPCLRILLLVPRRYDRTYAPDPEGGIPAQKFVDLQNLLLDKYRGLSLPRRSFQAPIVQGLWSDQGIDYPPEFHRVIDVVTNSIAADDERRAEEHWLLNILYSFVKQEFGQQQVFLLIQDTRRAIEQ